MKIGIIGTGNVGGSLGRLWSKHGHEIMFATRDPESAKVQALLTDVLTSSKNGARVGSLEETLRFAEIMVLAIPWAAVRETLTSVNGWSGKILIDATNRLIPPEADSRGSAAEDVAGYAPGAKVVKAFNSIGADQLANPVYEGQAASMFVCGDDATAKQMVMQLAGELGFEPVDCGGLANAVLVEAMAKLWIYLARSGMGRNHAFKLLKR